MKQRTTKKNKKPQDLGIVQIVGRKTALCIAGFLLSGIATSLLTGMFDAWAIALKNASTGFLRKFADTYVIRAAGTELTDGASALALSAFILFGFGLWMFVKFFEVEQNRIDRELADLTKTDKQTQTNDLQPLLHELENQHKQRIAKLVASSAKGNKELRWLRWLCRVTLVLMCYGLSLQEVSYALVKAYRGKVVRARPFMTDLETYQLNRQWVMMKSWKDYRTIMHKLSEYEQRSDSSELEKQTIAE